MLGGWASLAQRLSLNSPVRNSFVPAIEALSAPTVVEQSEHVLERPEPVDVEPFLPAQELNEYQELCQELGYKPRALTEQRVTSFLQEHGIPVYDLESVGAYLESEAAKLRKAREVGSSWVSIQWEWSQVGEHQRLWEDGTITTSKGYDKAIPVRILKQAAVIKREFPAATFHVSDFTVRYADPFISVLIDGVRVVFGVWDEPGFKG